eukprot:scaffold5209_cov35-Cyclotella_meneghiniana.AAC.1
MDLRYVSSHKNRCSSWHSSSPMKALTICRPLGTNSSGNGGNRFLFATIFPTSSATLTRAGELPLTTVTVDKNEGAMDVFEGV